MASERRRSSEEIPALKHSSHDLMRGRSMVSNPGIEYKSEVSNLVKELD